jgi:hypothetical protein
MKKKISFVDKTNLHTINGYSLELKSKPFPVYNDVIVKPQAIQLENVFL